MVAVRRSHLEEEHARYLRCMTHIKFTTLVLVYGNAFKHSNGLYSQKSENNLLVLLIVLVLMLALFLITLILHGVRLIFLLA